MNNKIRLTYPNSKNLKMFDQLNKIDTCIDSNWATLLNLFGSPYYNFNTNDTLICWKFFINKIPFKISTIISKKINIISTKEMVNIKILDIEISYDYHIDECIPLLISYYDQQKMKKSNLGEFEIIEKVNEVIEKANEKNLNVKIDFNLFSKELDIIINNIKSFYFKKVCSVDTKIIDINKEHEITLKVSIEDNDKLLNCLLFFKDNKFIYDTNENKIEKYIVIKNKHFSEVEKTEFNKLLNKFCKECHNLAIEKGFYDGKEIEDQKIPIMLALIHSEVSEALAEYRKWNELEFKKELADIAIRLFDLAAYKGIDLGKEIMEKHEFNKTRPYKHGNKRF